MIRRHFAFFCVLNALCFSALSLASDYSRHMPVGQADKERLSYQHDMNFPYTEQHLANIEFAGKTVLEVGCGSGEMLAFFSEKVGPNGHVIAIDNNDEQLGIARQKITDAHLANVTVVKADITALSAEQKELYFNKIDIVFSRFVAMHIPKNTIQIAIENIYNLLKKGGIWCSEETIINGARSSYRNDIISAYKEYFISSRTARGLDALIYQRLSALCSSQGFETSERFFEKPVLPEQFRQTVLNLRPVLEKGGLNQAIIDDWMSAVEIIPENTETYLNGLHCLSATK